MVRVYLLVVVAAGTAIALALTLVPASEKPRPAPETAHWTRNQIEIHTSLRRDAARHSGGLEILEWIEPEPAIMEFYSKAFADKPPTAAQRVRYRIQFEGNWIELDRVFLLRDEVVMVSMPPDSYRQVCPPK